MDTKTQLYKALKVLVSGTESGRWLSEHDPKLLEQARKAVSAFEKEKAKGIADQPFSGRGVKCLYCGLSEDNKACKANQFSDFHVF